jgi:hypothetical protein
MCRNKEQAGNHKPSLGAQQIGQGDRESAEGALERNLLANKIIGLFTMQTPFLTIRTVAHNLKIIAILKLPKLALCPLPAITTQSPRGEGRVRGVSHGWSRKKRCLLFTKKA